jgi:magnesium-transporting ATPase (P-type)
MEPLIENRKIELDQETLNHLNTARKWSMFIGIIGFILLGIIIVAGILAGTFLAAFNTGDSGSDLPDAVVMAVVLTTGIISLFHVFFLVRFSKHASNAIRLHDSNEFKKAVKSLKLYFIYIGILIIILLSGYLAAFVISGSSVSLI